MKNLRSLCFLCAGVLVIVLGLGFVKRTQSMTRGASEAIAALGAGQDTKVQQLFSQASSADRATIFSYAVKENMPLLVKAMLEIDPSQVNVRDPLSAIGETPLLIAAFLGYPDVVKILVDAKADASIKDRNNTNALQAALDGDAQGLRTDATEKILANLAQAKSVEKVVNEKDEYGQSILVKASGRPSIVKALLTIPGIDVNNPSCTELYGQQECLTPLASARKRGDQESVALLKAAGARE